VHILKQLALCCRGVSTEEDVDLSSKSSSATLRKLLTAATEKLAQDSFLDIMILPDAGCKSIDELFVELRVHREILESLDLLLSKHALMVILEQLVLDSCLIDLFVHWLVLSIGILLIDIHIESALISPHKVDDINVSAIDILHDSCMRVHSHTHGFVDTDSFNSITWLYKVDQVFIDTQMNSVRSLSLWNCLWSLLNLYMLLISEETIIVNHRESVSLLAIITKVRLKNAPTLDELILLEVANLALECCFFHFRNDIRVPYHNTLY
jgi:hypothetical protein